MAKITGFFLEYGFMACKEKFMEGYPPTREEPSFLNLEAIVNSALDPFANPLVPMTQSLPYRIR
ncbi:UNVERIFIED_CONTAM: hypothetical protein Sradi_4852900 [Sesamum radiatum]|uniref:Uncharacterized protein n=1 Tax=Sesamum radiatum TaxID=300843 RepID=A0AAW2MYX2_SESRA